MNGVGLINDECCEKIAHFGHGKYGNSPIFLTLLHELVVRFKKIKAITDQWIKCAITVVAF